MKLSECSRGRLVRLASLTYDEAIKQHKFGHINNVIGGMDGSVWVVLTRVGGRSDEYPEYKPEDLTPMED